MDNSLVDKYELINKKAKIKIIILSILSIVLFIISAVFITLFILEKTNDEESSEIVPSLTLWNDCELKNKLVNYVQKITKEGSKDFIKKEDRIAVFDFDGTLFQETDPVYTDFKLYKYRVLDDPNYISKATDEQISVAKEIEELMETGVYHEGLDLRHAKVNAEIFGNMTIEESDNYIKDFMNQPAEGYNNLKRGDAFYKPMLQVVEYLQKNDFIIYILSGSDRYLVRAIIDGHVNIPSNYIIGTDAGVIATHQGDIDGLNYIYRKDDELIFQGKLIVKNLQMNKVQHIIREIGKTPLLSFGNSSGDSSMANYVITNKKYEGLSFMLLCDDTTRENGNPQKAQNMKNQCNENGWIPVSMKDDWKTIYGDDVTRK